MAESVLRSVAAEAATMPELGEALSAQLQRHVPHDGYILAGLDPASGIGCLIARRNCYSPAARYRLEVDGGGADPHRWDDLFAGGCPVAVKGSGFTDESRDGFLHGLMAEEGFGAELCLALVERGVPRGGLLLLRERGRQPFQETEADAAARLAGELAASVRCFVAGRLLRPPVPAAPPGVVLVGPDHRIRAATPAGRDWLRVLQRETAVGDDELDSMMLPVALAAQGRPTVTRVPTSVGWVVVDGQSVDGTGDVAVTIGLAGGATLLPAVAGWYRITARERAVVEQALLGLPVKQIARRLDLSPHTVNDYFRTIYRKTYVTSREELVSALSV
ncbi:helix-turn-helix transcriptional regulator [Longispora fulva]|uniref:DNA-binding CsgD family transcriptional regulator n=1 Tax=Longispora fulva TaxID=619741 RepID=A0A8J7GPD6_9ACTN|nr:helix-turn-helix transcriptional regulator [Longispora fulva]MBG6134386.1 DNA-binding CsgD family transcriptional regulator [Longispora fulva]